MLAISLLKNSIWFPRYLLFIAPYFLILLAAGFMVVWHWRRQAAITIAIAYFIGVGGGLKDYYTTFYRNDWQGAAKLITVNEQPGDAIVFHGVHSDSWKPEHSLKRYYQGNSPVYLISNPGEDREFDREFILNELGTIPTVESRLWLVCWRVCKPEKENLIFEMMMGENFQIQTHEIFDETMEFQPIEIFLVTENSSEKQINSP
jgi:mannosyltransferase